MSALSLKTQIEEEKGKKNVKVIIYFYALLSLRIMTVFWICVLVDSGTDVQVKMRLIIFSY